MSDVAHGPLVIIEISVFNYSFIPSRYQNKIYHNLGLELGCRGFFSSKLISSFISDRKFLLYNNRKF